MSDQDQMKLNSVNNLKLNAILDNSQSMLRMVAKVYMKPHRYERLDKDLKRQITNLDKSISEIMNIGVDDTAEKIGNWWVTNHDTVPENKRVSGPYTTSADAGRARTILERFEQHNNYWIEQLEED